jgi:hypothetical protein
MYSPEVLRQRVQEEEDRIAQLSKADQLEEKQAFRKCTWDYTMDRPEDYALMLRWRAYRNQEERQKKEQQKQVEEERHQAEIRRQETLEREAEEKAKRHAEWEERLERLRQQEAQRAALRQERHRLATEKWANLIRKTEGKSKFQLQLKSPQKSIPNEFREWRSRIAWQYREGKAIKIEPPFPTPLRDTDLQEARLAIWRKEAQKYCEEDEQKEWEQDNLARLKQVIRPENLTYMALWDEWFILRKKSRDDRSNLILKEITRRNDQRRYARSMQPSERKAEKEEFQEWNIKYGQSVRESLPQIYSKKTSRYRELLDARRPIIWEVLSDSYKESYFWKIKATDLDPNWRTELTPGVKDIMKWLEKQEVVMKDLKKGWTIKGDTYGDFKSFHFERDSRRLTETDGVDDPREGGDQ